MATTTRGILAGCLLFVAGALSASAQAGVALGATRVIYPAGQKQVQLAVTNNDDNSTWLIQSWVENADGQRDGRFVITPRCLPCRAKREHPAHYRRHQ
jgi:fimbrial chaperone protein